MVCLSEYLLQAAPLRIVQLLPNCLKDIDAEALLADKGCDTNELIEMAVRNNIEPLIPPKKNRKEQRYYDKAI